MELFPWYFMINVDQSNQFVGLNKKSFHIFGYFSFVVVNVLYSFKFSKTIIILFDDWKTKSISIIVLCLSVRHYWVCVCKNRSVVFITLYEDFCDNRLIIELIISLCSALSLMYVLTSLFKGSSSLPKKIQKLYFFLQKSSNIE